MKHPRTLVPGITLPLLHPSMFRLRLPVGLAFLSPALWVIVLVAGTSTAAMLTWPKAPREAHELWTFAQPHHAVYEPAIATWNETHPELRFDAHLLQTAALERRVLSGFLSGAPLPDLVEVERFIAGRSFMGPQEAIGFSDLTARLREEGWLDRITPATFSPWTAHGRIHGLPRAVHPVALAYRADIIEAAGIDMQAIETWDDFRQTLAPMMSDRDGDGRPDRHLVNFWPAPASKGLIEVLLLQAGGRMFDENGRPDLANETNVRVFARLATWIAGPERFAIDAPEYSAGGNQMRNSGMVLCSIMPDWLAGSWRTFNPALAGRVKLIPLPAWEPGGRRTSVMGGSMIGIPKAAPDFAASWAMAQHLYFSDAVVEAMFRNYCVISPVATHYSLPAYHEPDPYFSGQKIGELFISLAPDVPARNSSPFSIVALERILSALESLRTWANREQRFTVAELEPEARRVLGEANAALQRQIERNVFVTRAAVAEAAP